MPSVVTLGYWGGLLLLGGFCALLLFKIVTGEIAFDGLFEGDIRESDGGYSSSTSAGRVQCFVVTIYAAFYYIVQVVQDPTRFPSLPTELVGAVAASQALYLGDKARAMLLGRMQNFFK
jgi:hypothetical protein